MRRIILLLLFDVLVSVGVATWLYFNRGVDAAFMSGLSIFIALSPICFVMASPFTLYLAGRKLSKRGIKLNHFDALKILAEVNLVALPYNRVLTCGEMFITDLAPQAMSQSNLLIMAASAERDAQNILGRMIFDTAVSRGLNLRGAKNFRELPGRGVEAEVDGTLIRVGNPLWLDAQGVSTSAILRTKIDQLVVKGKTALLVSTGRAARGIIALKDELNVNARKFLGELKRANVQTLLLTSQPKKMANRIAKDFALDHIRTNLTPEGKAREVQIFRAKGNLVAVIGNDPHDLPALLSADVSFFIRNDESTIGDDVALDVEIPTLESFLTVREVALKVISVLKLNRRLALASWIVLVPPALMTALDKPPIPFHPLAAVAGVAIFSAIILTNSLRTK